MTGGVSGRLRALGARLGAMLRIKGRRALGAGAGAAAAAVLVVGALRWLGGASVDPVGVLGRLLVPPPVGFGWAWLAGAVAHVLGGAGIALGYAAVFEWITRRAGVWLGLAVAVLHALVAGLALAWVPLLRPDPFAPEPPGAFFEYANVAGVVAFWAFVGVYGALVGRWYGRPLHQGASGRGEVVVREVRV